MIKLLKMLVSGMASFIPGVNTNCTPKKTRGTDSARYCYSVWLRHLVMAKKNGLNTFPELIAELGPGDSLGIGLAALISGSTRYYAFDVVKYANNNCNLEIFDELVNFFKNREPIPGEIEFPRVKPYLDDYSFPSDILDEKRLIDALEPSRLEKIRNSIINPHHTNSVITYIVPWNDPNILESESVDLIYSQAVLEHVDDLFNAYKSMYYWLKPNGFLSHQIDFKCHGTADEWNGHWTYSDAMWKIIRGKKLYLINREPHSTHISLLKEIGFEVITDRTIETESKYSKNKLNSRFKTISDKDLITSGAFIQANKSQMI